MIDYKEETALIRKDIFLAASQHKFAHLASAFSCVEILYSLYLCNIMNYDSKAPMSEERDRFIMSKGHGSLALYSVLNRAGFFSRETLMQFCKPNTILGGEPNALSTPGVEASTGSLGHGLSFAVGIAIANKIDKKQNHTYVLIGDGELQEGSVWEAIMLAVRFELDNLTLIIDNNKIQKMGTIDEISGICSWSNRFEAFGWCVEEVDGHNVEAVVEVLKNKSKNNMPKVVIANTIKGKGVSFMENNPSWHWRMPNKKETRILSKELNICEEEISDAKSIYNGTI